MKIMQRRFRNYSPLPKLTLFGILIVLMMVLFSAFGSSARSQEIWTRHHIGFMNGPICVQTADMNADGLDDVVAASYTANLVVWYENPSWTPHLIGGITDPSFLKVADMDQDGDLDVVVTSGGSEPVVWFESIPGNWVKKIIDNTILISTYGPECLDLFDFSGDDTLDVVAAGSQVVWFEWPNWTPHFIDPQPGGPNGACSALCMGDINGDSNLDLVAAAWISNSWLEGVLLWYDLINSTKDTIASPYYATYGIACGDFDNDSDCDVASTSYGYNRVDWYENLNGSWQTRPVDPYLNNALPLIAFDADYDNYLDLFVGGNYNPGWVGMYRNHLPDWEENKFGELRGARSLAAGDIDGDLDMDLVACGYGADSILWYENPDPYIHVPSEVPTIQAGIDSANDGDTVLVNDGIYYENINFKGKAITVASRFLVDSDTNHINNTIIDGSQPSNPDSGSVVFFVSGEDTNAVLCGFTIINGTGTTSGYNKYGGGIFCQSSGCKILSNKIISNIASGSSAYGGGFAIIGNATSYAILKGNQIKDNKVEAITNWGQGGGVEFYLSDGEIIDNIISHNECKSISNQAIGGGIQCYGGIRVLIKDNIITDNLAVSDGIVTGAPEALGGGIDIWGCYAMVLNNKISNNSLSALENTSGAGITFDHADSSIIDGNLIVNNTTNVTGRGGGINLWMSDALITNNVVYQNSTTYGGGIYSGSSETSIVNNTIINNNANYGGGIYFLDSGAKVMNTILWSNQASTGPQIRIYGSSSVAVAYSDVQVQGLLWPGEGNISKEPMLHGENRVLSDSSSCIGAGTLSHIFSTGTVTCPTLCYMGNARPTPSNTPPDMGACESPLDSPVVGLEKQLSHNLPKSYDLKQNYPNPFNPSTTIEFDLPKSSEVTLKIFNILGEEVYTLVSDRLSTGSYSYKWDAAKLASGVYLYRLQAGDYIETRKMVLMK